MHPFFSVLCAKCPLYLLLGISVYTGIVEPLWGVCPVFGIVVFLPIEAAELRGKDIFYWYDKEIGTFEPKLW